MPRQLGNFKSESLSFCNGNAFTLFLRTLQIMGKGKAQKDKKKLMKNILKQN